ncbi:phage major capsid protein [Pleionea sp. CnH1-48]|uniref:phage major capsid protein n=1 Tax=Pleionea sp. CnH1-48 TaxID=2954494 RepID=UPI00209794FF|nr:phage major capsid protein [Pleionea sp. CnH1-48]MCO7225769.1 phage major capsid protein [Pleionea sp. CnH1-48]
MSYLAKLKEKRSKLASDMVALNKKAKDEKRGFTPDEREQWEKMSNDITDYDQRIETEERAALLEAEESTVTNPLPTGEQRSRESEDKESALNSAFDKFLRHGLSALESDERTLLREMRAQSVGTQSEGGYLAPDEFGNRIIETMKAFGGIRSAATVLTTSNGNRLPFPTNDGTNEIGEIIDENTQHNEGDTVFGEVDISAYAYSSKIIRVSEALLQDSAINLESFIGRRMGMRIGRAQALHFAKGTGTKQPRGLMVAAPVGYTAPSATALTWRDFIKLKHSVDPAYRLNARWAFADSVLEAAKLLTDGNNRPLWMPGIASANASTIDGDRYVVDQGIDAIGNAKVVAAYGDLSQYLIRDVRGMRVKRLTERYADYDQVGFLAIMRTDANLLDTAAIKTLQMAA